MGKYAGLKGKLPPGPRSGDTTVFRDLVDRFKADAHAQSISGAKKLMQHYRKEREEKERKDAELTEASARTRAAEELLLETMDEMGVTQLKGEDGTLFYEEFKPSAKILDPDAAELWAHANGHEFLFGLVSQRVAPFVKEMALAGQEIPPCFELQSYTQLKMRKGAQSGTEKGVNRSTEEEPF